MENISFSNHISWQLIPNKKFAFAYNLYTKQYYKFKETAMVIWMYIAENEPIKKSDLVLKVAKHYEIDMKIIELDAVSYTHLTLPTNSRV